MRTGAKAISVELASVFLFDGCDVDGVEIPGLIGKGTDYLLSGLD